MQFIPLVRSCKCRIFSTKIATSSLNSLISFLLQFKLPQVSISSPKFSQHLYLYLLYFLYLFEPVNSAIPAQPCQLSTQLSKLSHTLTPSHPYATKLIQNNNTQSTQPPIQQKQTQQTITNLVNLVVSKTEIQNRPTSITTFKINHKIAPNPSKK